MLEIAICDDDAIILKTLGSISVNSMMQQLNMIFIIVRIPCIGM